MFRSNECHAFWSNLICILSIFDEIVGWVLVRFEMSFWSLLILLLLLLLLWVIIWRKTSWVVAESLWWIPYDNKKKSPLGHHRIALSFIEWSQWPGTLYISSALDMKHVYPSILEFIDSSDPFIRSNFQFSAINKICPVLWRFLHACWKICIRTLEISIEKDVSSIHTERLLLGHLNYPPIEEHVKSSNSSKNSWNSSRLESTQFSESTQYDKMRHEPWQWKHTIHF